MIRRHWPKAVLLVGVILTLIWIVVLGDAVIHFATYLF
jgi:hypothetical protein